MKRSILATLAVASLATMSLTGATAANAISPAAATVAVAAPDGAAQSADVSQLRQEFNDYIAGLDSFPGSVLIDLTYMTRTDATDSRDIPTPVVPIQPRPVEYRLVRQPIAGPVHEFAVSQASHSACSETSAPWQPASLPTGAPAASRHRRPHQEDQAAALRPSLIGRHVSGRSSVVRARAPSGTAQRWIDNSRRRLVTETANRLADELLSQGTLGWLRTALSEGKK
ncbi:hypothetical protein [Streptomyces sp. NPDC056255]|uniref:hypothetical protein n=1 Tax=Streptomyces sp. NPDC056255 TaxID=3345764 RepID=UPI0035DAB36B